MYIDIAFIREKLLSFPLTLSVERIDTEAIRFATPFTYRNGEHIDLFLRPEDYDSGGCFILSDGGTLSDHLQDFGFNLFDKADDARISLVDRLCESAGAVRGDGDDVYIILGEGDLREITGASVNLIQLIIRLAEIGYSAGK